MLASQKKMYGRLQKTPDKAKDPVLARKFNVHLRKIDQWIRENDRMDCLYVQHREVIDAPLERAREIRAFLGLPLDVEAMAGVVDPELYRNRGGGGRASDLK